MSAYIARHLGLDASGASALRQRYWDHYGATLLGLVRHHDVEPGHFLEETHRLPGLEDRAPRRALLTRGEAVEGWTILRSPEEIFTLGEVNDLLVEGGSGAATAFLAADLIDRLMVYRAPILVGEGKSSVGWIGLESLAEAHGRWRMSDARPLGADRLEVYERIRD